MQRGQRALKQTMMRNLALLFTVALIATSVFCHVDAAATAVSISSPVASEFLHSQLTHLSQPNAVESGAQQLARYVVDTMFHCGIPSDPHFVADLLHTVETRLISFLNPVLVSLRAGDPDGSKLAFGAAIRDAATSLVNYFKLQVIEQESLGYLLSLQDQTSSAVISLINEKDLSKFLNRSISFEEKMVIHFDALLAAFGAMDDADPEAAAEYRELVGRYNHVLQAASILFLQNLETFLLSETQSCLVTSAISYGVVPSVFRLQALHRSLLQAYSDHRSLLEDTRRTRLACPMADTLEAAEILLTGVRDLIESNRHQFLDFAATVLSTAEQHTIAPGADEFTLEGYVIRGIKSLVQRKGVTLPDFSLLRELRSNQQLETAFAPLKELEDWMSATDTLSTKQLFDMLLSAPGKCEFSSKKLLQYHVRIAGLIAVEGSEYLFSDALPTADQVITMVEKVLDDVVALLHQDVKKIHSEVLKLQTKAKKDHDMHKDEL